MPRQSWLARCPTRHVGAAGGWNRCSNNEDRTRPAAGRSLADRASQMGNQFGRVHAAGRGFTLCDHFGLILFLDIYTILYIIIYSVQLKRIFYQNSLQI